MNSGNLSLAQEINLLWDPVYPYMAQHILECYGRREGNILEMGPFSGAIFALQEAKIGNSFQIAAFPPGMGPFFRGEAEKRGIRESIAVIDSNPSLLGIRNDEVDLVVFRGAFFFPTFFQVDFQAIDRVLRPKGVAFVGGGFGKFTPAAMIQEMGERSRHLNLKLGKCQVTQEDLYRAIPDPFKERTEMISEGGLWLVMRK